MASLLGFDSQQSSSDDEDGEFRLLLPSTFYLRSFRLLEVACTVSWNTLIAFEVTKIQALSLFLYYFKYNSLATSGFAFCL